MTVQAQRYSRGRKEPRLAGTVLESGDQGAPVLLPHITDLLARHDRRQVAGSRPTQRVHAMRAADRRAGWALVLRLLSASAADGRHGKGLDSCPWRPHFARVGTGSVESPSFSRCRDGRPRSLSLSRTPSLFTRSAVSRRRGSEAQHCLRELRLAQYHDQEVAVDDREWQGF